MKNEMCIHYHYFTSFKTILIDDDPVAVPDHLQRTGDDIEWGIIDTIKLPNLQKVKIDCFVALEGYDEEGKIGCVTQILGNRKGGQHVCYIELEIYGLTTDLVAFYGMRGLVKLPQRVWVTGKDMNRVDTWTLNRQSHVC
ncbi:uncharacterized protein MELLADRAFT_107422 [Melampsora larici-populina 98AG31]|uniref:Uncharacterized protein n=1 Tax=Melampsora larici-populina (strain 98AG31 / pathotype 3-4-7) TaxID=747676 RepID=F4RPR0_MELLP|nr:uncharacterized protein MELLADRAFT_107422 [Melampsora larici-populina 98AG31]EGG05586.1 hypothetical protein MELLADRAFT_107422 [Melampsora larici-populina 98AG31]